jgi:hypothetical protein
MMPPTFRRNAVRLAATVFAAWAIAACANEVRAGGPENVALIVNAESASSKLLANHYIFRRRIPASNVIYLDKIPRYESMSIEEFRKLILVPITQQINERSLGAQIDYIVYSSGFPTIVTAPLDRNNLYQMAIQRGAIIPLDKRLLVPHSSLNSATFFYQRILREDPTYLSLVANRYMRNDTGNLLRTPFIGDDQVQFEKAVDNIRDESYDQAIAELEKLAERHPLQYAVHYLLARAFALKGDDPSALLWLKRAMQVGWSYRDYTRADSAFSRLADDKLFRDVVAQIPAQSFDYLPTTGFRSQYAWGPNGVANSQAGSGEQYVLSTLLGVNRNLGNSEHESLDQLLRSIAADGTIPQGTFYFNKNDDIRSHTRLPYFGETVAALREMGHKAEIIEDRVPQNRNDIAGLMMGTASFRWPASNEILPGAICDSFTSFGGLLSPDTRQTKLTEFLRQGAAGSSGTVVEPLSYLEKFPHPRLHLHYARGCTLAEAFYQSVRGPFQLLIVGDALCKPWAIDPKIVVKNIAVFDKPVSGLISLEIDSSQSPTPVEFIELFVNGRFARRMPAVSNLNVDTTSMPDGYHELRLARPIEIRSSAIVPIVVDNAGQEVLLESDANTFDIGDTITFRIKSSEKAELQLRHNFRLIAAELNSDVAEFKIPAFQFGRGPVIVTAFAKIDDQFMQSRPLKLEITGAVSTTTPIVQDPNQKPKKKKPANPKRTKTGTR